MSSAIRPRTSRCSASGRSRPRRRSAERSSGSRTRRLRARMRELNASLPVQPRVEYARRVVRFAGLLVLARPRLYAAFARLLGDRLDATVNGAVRGFAADELLARIRRRPSAPLLALLERRLRRFDGRRLRRRTEARRARRGIALVRGRPSTRSTTRTGCSPSPRTIPTRSSLVSGAPGSTRRGRRAPSAPCTRRPIGPTSTR